MAAAEICYLSATALAPDDADLQLQMGHLYKLQRRYADAASHYRRAAELSPYLVDAHRELADVNILAEAELAAGTSAHADGGDDEVWDYQEPVPHATITIEEADWESDERLAERAAEATGKELNGAAAVLLRARVARAPTDRARWYELAAALDVMGDAQQAARCRAIAASLAA